MYKKTLLSLAVASSVGLTGCLDDSSVGGNANPDYKIENENFSGKTWPLFNPATSEVPLPNDFIFDSEAGDGTFAVADTQPPVTTALNSLSGASTVAPAVIQFNGQIDADTVVLGETVFVVAVNYASGDPVQALSIGAPPTASPDDDQPMLKGEIRADVETLSGNSAIRLLPLKPLDPRQRYVVGITKGVKDVNGDPIVASPSYSSLTNPDEALVSDALAPIRGLINGFWEPTLAKATGASTDNFAMSYSFTTSNDEKVLEYIAEPGIWFADQLETFVGVSTSRQVTGAARFLGGDELTVDGGWDINGDGSVTAADFDVNGDGNLTPADFDFDGNGEFGYQDVNMAVQGQKAAFPSAGIQQSLSPIFDNAPPGGCQGLTNVAAMKCAGNALASQFAGLLPDISDGGISFDSAVPVGGISAVAESLRGELPAQDAQGGSKRSGVLAAQSTIDLPYYLGTDKDTVQTVNWEADAGLAAGLNAAFEPLGLSIPQADPSVSKAVNYIFPFPKERTTVEAPVLALYPDDLGSEAPKGVVMYQHGITTDRSAALTFGTALASYGYVVIAIDQPLHGVTPFSTEEQEGLALELLTGAGFPEQQAQQLVPAAIAPDQAALVSAFEAAGQTTQEATASAQSLINTVAGAGSTVPGIQNSGNERHFNLFAGAQGQIQSMSFDTSDPAGADESGSLYINLNNFLAAGDNNRQSAVDQMTLRASLNGLELPDGQGGTAYTLDTQGTDSVNFAGHSLGTITGASYISSVNQNSLNIAADTPGNPTGNPIPLANADNDIAAASMLTPGGGVVRLLENSPTFAPQILLGLQQNGIEQGSASFETFMNVFQHAIDSADPVNFTDNNGLRTTTQLLSMVEGDSVIPNAADADVWGDGNGPLNRTVPADESAAPVPVTVNSFPAPLAGSLPLTQAFGTGITDGQNSPLLSTYSSGSHRTPVSASPASVFVQMVLETDVTFNPQS
ncbi:hypothetical protein CF392_00470 [Tamilnaduibacter salinus]|uniref:Bacterial virulence factor lipase N-terminal domain-containing protein n=1 Tax=Tamilnaduibacter salinus TaxID=1484056 RepID=A0A2A2I8N3_9GAMM|nr:hypothetical protein [Tamilnaduibacter salinus]PAV27423.1 hypothetical protein CF392_00470 [Tamilnaduibacter salinus]